MAAVMRPPRALSLIGVVLVIFSVGLHVSLGQETDPCSNYITLEENWRNPETDAAPNHCDSYPVGWYTFQVDKQPAEIPTLCMQDNTCGARVPLHVDMEGQGQPGMGESITAWLCGSFNVLGAVDCCVQRQPVTIKRCSDSVLIYRLKPQLRCPVAVCAQQSGSVISGHLLAKPGDVPRSLGSNHSYTSDWPGSPTAPTPTTEVQAIERTLGTIAHTSPPPTSSATPFSAAHNPTTSSSSFSSSADSAHSFNSSAIFPSNDTSDDIHPFSTNSSTPEHISRENITNEASNRPHSSDAGLDNETSSAENNNMAPISGNFTSGHNDTDGEESEGSLGDDATTPEVKPSHRTTLSAASSADVKNVSGAAGGASSPAAGATTSAGAGAGFASTPGVAGEGVTVVVVPMVSEPPVPEELSDAVRFVLNGTYEEDDFRDTLLLFLSNVSRELTAGYSDEEGLHNLTLLVQTSPSQLLTVVDVLVADPTTNGTIPAQRFVTVLKNDNFAEILLSRTGQTLIEVCPTIDLCGLEMVRPGDGAFGGGGSGGRHQSLFDRNRGIFIAVIVVAACCLLALLVGLLLLRYRRRGVWVLAPDQEEKGNEVLAVENPMTDHQILSGESCQEAPRESETTLTINGDHHHHPHHPTYASNGGQDNGHGSNIPAADEDNGWVVPLDQAPSPVTSSPSAAASHGLADKTEDTQF